MMSVLNLSAQYADLWGGGAYEHRFSHHLWPLTLISIALSMLALPFVAVLPIPNHESEESRGFEMGMPSEETS